MSSDLAVDARGIGKRYGDRWVLRDVDLQVPSGSVLGLLGPNGAGKTTAVRILTTLLRPDEGTAFVAGLDVVRDAEQVRSHFGLAGQQASVDDLLSGFANLEMVGRLSRLGRTRARQRAEELLERFELVESGRRLVRTYSGGMRRRLDLAASLVAAPPVLFLDEPTTGLDPHSRNELWTVLRELVTDGTTLLLTTQYLEEADRLADRIVIVDHGRIVAEGDPRSLKDAVGRGRIEVIVAESTMLAATEAVLTATCGGPAIVEADELKVSVPVGEAGLAAVVRALDAAGLPSDDVALHRPTLDDVFLTFTGHPAEEDAA